VAVVLDPDAGMAELRDPHARQPRAGIAGLAFWTLLG